MRPFTADEWRHLSNAVKKIIRTTAYPIAKEYDEPNQPPTITDGLIAFNGVGDDGHETFWLERHGHGFNFCKTAEKPYDVVVVATLIVADAIAPGVLLISSDGDPAEWEPGLTLARQALPNHVLAIPKGVVVKKF